MQSSFPRPVRVFSGGAKGTILFFLVALLVCGAGAQDLLRSVRITVRDQQQKPVAGAQVLLKSDGKTLRSLTTDAHGETGASNLSLAHLQVVVTKQDFQPLTHEITPATGESQLELEITLLPRLVKQETVVVQGEKPLEMGSSPAQEMDRQEMKSSTVRPNTVAEALPLTPGVVRGPQGVSVAGAGEKHTALLVNSVDATDPATGQFGLTLPVDAVESLTVSTPSFLAEYGGYTSGVVSTVTRSGGDKWNFELNDPMPEFRIRSRHLEGLQSFSPHITFGGPLLKQQLYFTDATEVSIDKTPVRTLPFPFNETKSTVANSFSQLDWVISPTHTLTGTFHVAPQSITFAGLDFFNPQPVTPDVRLNSSAVALADRLALPGGVLQSTIAEERFSLGVTSQGPQDMVVTPEGNQGNYFAGQSRHSSRIEWIETYGLEPIHLKGTHNLQFGTLLSNSQESGGLFGRPVDIEANGALLQRIEFVGGRPFHRNDLEVAGFAQDRWAPTPSLSLDAGMRLEEQGITGTLRLAPRAGFAWTPPVGSKHTTIRGGMGVFYDHVPLNIYAFRDYPQQIVTTYNPGGQIIDGPRTFVDLIANSYHSLAGVRRRKQPGNFAPYSVGSSFELEHIFTGVFKITARYSLRNSYGLVTVSPELLSGNRGALVERDNGVSQYREFTVTSKIGKESGRKLFFSYTRSEARGNLNESSSYVGNIPFPILRRDFRTLLPSDVPNRFLVWGDSKLPWRMRIIPMVEFRTGFPYAVTNAYQNYVGIPNTDLTRFPSYFSLDTRVAKDFPLNAKYTARVSVRGLNLTNHFNALAVHSNTADPQFGTFFGSYNRRFRLDFDMLF